MKFALLALPFLALVYGPDGDLVVGSSPEEAALFGLPFTADSQIVFVSHPSQYQQRLTIRPVTPSNISVRLQMYEPAVQIQSSDTINQPLKTFYLHHE